MLGIVFLFLSSSKNVSKIIAKYLFSRDRSTSIHAIKARTALSQNGYEQVDDCLSNELSLKLVLKKFLPFEFFLKSREEATECVIDVRGI